MILNLISRLLSSKKDEDYRSAGACPPRVSEAANDGEGNLACACGMRGPKPYEEGMPFFHRSAGACPPRTLPGEGPMPRPGISNGFRTIQPARV